MSDETPRDGNGKPTFERSAETQAIVDLIRSTSMEPGTEIPYERISEALGCDIINRRHSLYSAIRILAKEDGIVIGCVRSEGIKILTDVEIGHFGTDTRKRQGRMSKRMFRSMTMVRDYESMPLEERNRLDAERAYHSMVASISADRAIKKIEAKLDQSGRVLPLGKTLDALKS